MEYSNICLGFADRRRTRCPDKCPNQQLQNSSWVEPVVNNHHPRRWDNNNYRLECNPLGIHCMS